MMSSFENLDITGIEVSLGSCGIISHRQLSLTIPGRRSAVGAFEGRWEWGLLDKTAAQQPPNRSGTSRSVFTATGSE